MEVTCLLIPRASDSMWSRLPTLSTLAPRSGCTARCVAISMPKRGTEVVALFLREHGLPRMLTFDNDPRFGGLASGRDFQISRWCAFCSVLGCNRVLIPPHRPDLNAYVERLHRSLGQECLQVHLPRTRKPGPGGHGVVSGPLQPGASQPGTFLRQPTAAGGLPDVPDAACCSPDRRDSPMARADA